MPVMAPIITPAVATAALLWVGIGPILCLQVVYAIQWICCNTQPPTPARPSIINSFYHLLAVPVLFHLKYVASLAIPGSSGILPLIELVLLAAIHSSLVENEVRGWTLCMATATWLLQLPPPDATFCFSLDVLLFGIHQCLTRLTTHPQPADYTPFCFVRTVVYHVSHVAFLHPVAPLWTLGPAPYTESALALLLSFLTLAGVYYDSCRARPTPHEAYAAEAPLMGGAATPREQP